MTKTQQAEHGSWFSDEELPGLRDFWQVYEGCYDELQGIMREPLERHASFGPILASTPKEQLEAQSADGRARVTRAVEHNEWGPYEEQVRVQGAVYVALGVKFRDWYDLIRVFERHMIPRLVTAYGSDLPRLGRAIQSMQEFLHRAMAVLGQSYIESKEAEERAVEKSRLRVAELESQARRMQDASRLKSEFLANMSHELRTPLNSIIGFAEMLHDGRVGAVLPKQKEFLGDILTSGRHLLQLINDVLDLSRVEAGKMEFRPEPVDLHRVVSEIISVLHPTAVEKQIRVDVSVSSDIGEVVLDAARLKQVLYNYMSNALKFTPEGGAVSVRIEPEGESRLKLTVEDTGIGIAPSDVTRLFAEFQQLEPGVAKKHGGTGLGLALTKRLVEAQGGSVGVESELGSGSRFHAILPRRAAAGAPRAPVAPLAGRRAGAPLILVVDDERADQTVITGMLTAAGYDVEIADTAARAVELTNERVYDAITLDLILPDASGLDVLRAVRSEGKNKDIPVVLITVVAEKVATGFVVNDVLGKPLDRDALLGALERARVVPESSGAVLVVDDDPGALKLMGATLEGLRYHPVCFADGESALRWAAAHKPAAIILDLVMPGLNGFQLLSRLRESPAHRHIPVLVWTSKDLSPDELAELRAAAQIVIRKGRGATDLVTKLGAYLPPAGVHRTPEGDHAS